jgi:hypothetical protein
MIKIIKDCLTEKNGESYDIIRILGVISFIVYNVITIKHSLDHCVDFEEINYSIGLSIILGIISAGVTYKYSKE